MDDKPVTEIKKFNYLTSEIDAAYHAAALRLGLTDSSMVILYAISCNDGECLLSEIARSSGVSKQTLNSALRKLEKEGIVCSETCGGRKKKLRLTEKGKVLTKQTVIKIIEAENEIFGSWSQAERRTYLELTQKYLDSFKKKLKEF